MEIRELALQIALSYEGQKEEPGNRGPFVADCLKLVGLPEGYSWCQAFVYRCYNEAAEELDVPNPVYKTAGVLNCWLHRKTGILKAYMTPENVLPGYQLIYDHGSGTGHTALVVATHADGAITTIEGNTNATLSRNGDGVYQLTRRHLNDAQLVGCICY